MGRAISDALFNDLKNGKLKPILEAVQNDTTLIMEFRGENTITIYYRGGSLFNIIKDNDKYTASFNPAYWGIKKKYEKLTEHPSLADCVDNIALYKDQMDYHMANADRNLEKQCQQRIVLENNILGKVNNDDPNSYKSSPTGDYFILDTEYDLYKNMRFDAIALKFPSLSPERQKRKGLGISFVEIKYYDGSMTGKAGVKKHIKDYIQFINSQEYPEMCADMQKVFLQKCSLGLIPSYTSRLKKDSDKYYNISIDPSNVEMIFIFANSDPDVHKAEMEFEKAINEFGKKDTQNIFVATSSEMGYVMFRYAKKGEKDLYIPISTYINSK